MTQKGPASCIQENQEKTDRPKASSGRDQRQGVASAVPAAGYQTRVRYLRSLARGALSVWERCLNGMLAHLSEIVISR
jgi:hypothetical protein